MKNISLHSQLPTYTVLWYRIRGKYRGSDELRGASPRFSLRGYRCGRDDNTWRDVTQAITMFLVVRCSMGYISFARASIRICRLI